MDFVFLTDHKDSFAHVTYPDTLLFDASRGDQLIERDGAGVANWAGCPGQDPAMLLAGTESGTTPVGLEHHVGANGDENATIYGEDTPDVFQRVYDFAIELPLYDVQITVQTAFPGTPLYRRLLKENRILEPGRWDLCTLFDVNYRPKNMTPQELRDGLYWLTERLYSEDCLLRRRRPFLEELWRQHDAGEMPDFACPVGAAC